MAVDRRRANEQWKPAEADGSITWDRVDTALLMDIRDELQKLNALLHCHRFVGIPHQLEPMAQAARRVNRQHADRLKHRRTARQKK